MRDVRKEPGRRRSDYRRHAAARRRHHSTRTGLAIDRSDAIRPETGPRTALSFRAVWPDTVVEENNLTQAIAALRKSLSDKPDEHRFIPTDPGRGYRFVAEHQDPRRKAEEEWGVPHHHPGSTEPHMADESVAS